MSGNARPLRSLRMYPITTPTAIETTLPASLRTANILARSDAGTAFPMMSIQGTLVIPINDVATA